MTNQYRESLLAEYARLAEATASYNAVAAASGWELVTGVDLTPGAAEPVNDPVIEVRDDGSALLRDYVAYIDECRNSDDRWLVKWATDKQPNGIPVARAYGMLPEIAKRPGLTDKQRGNILQSCGLAAFLGGARDTGMTDREYAAKTFFGMDYSQGAERVAIMDCHAYMEAKPQSGFPGAKLADVRFYAQKHAQEWILQAKMVKGNT